MLSKHFIRKVQHTPLQNNKRIKGWVNLIDRTWKTYSVIFRKYTASLIVVDFIIDGRQQWVTKWYAHTTHGTTNFIDQILELRHLRIRCSFTRYTETMSDIKADVKFTIERYAARQTRGSRWGKGGEMGCEHLGIRGARARYWKMSTANSSCVVTELQTSTSRSHTSRYTTAR